MGERMTCEEVEERLVGGPNRDFCGIPSQGRQPMIALRLKRRGCFLAASVLAATLLPTACKPNATSAADTSSTTTSAAAAVVGDAAQTTPADASAVAVVPAPDHDPAQPPIDCPLRTRGIDPTKMRPFEQVEDSIAVLDRPDRDAWQKPEPTAAAPDVGAGEPETEVPATGGGEARGRIWRTGRFVCVHEAATVDVSQGAPPVPVGSCKNWPGDSAVDFAQSRAMCGPCGFWLDAEQSRRQRAATADACCYLVSSPPPPPPPPSPPPA